MQLLLVAQEQVTASKAPCAFGTLEWFLLGVRPLMSLEMLQAGERALASAADVGARFIGLGRREGSGGLGVDHDG